MVIPKSGIRIMSNLIATHIRRTHWLLCFPCPLVPLSLSPFFYHMLRDLPLCAACITLTPGKKLNDAHIDKFLLYSDRFREPPRPVAADCNDARLNRLIASNLANKLKWQITSATTCLLVSIDSDSQTRDIACLARPRHRIRMVIKCNEVARQLDRFSVASAVGRSSDRSIRRACITFFLYVHTSA